MQVGDKRGERRDAKQRRGSATEEWRAGREEEENGR